MRKLLVIASLMLVFSAQAQENPKTLIREVNRKFSQVQDYSADIAMQFNIPGVKLNSMNGKVFYKRPDKFRIKAKGIFFMPKQNPMQQINSLLLDSASYTSVISGYENVEGARCAIINIIPLKSDNELILGKFWIDIQNPLVRKSQITTKNNGTIESESHYGSEASYNLPASIKINVEVNKIKVPKMMAVDLNKKSKPKADANAKETGTILMRFDHYKINSKLSDSEFVEVKE